MSIITSVWRAYRRRRPRTQVLIASLVVVLFAAATGEEAPSGRTDPVIEQPSDPESAGASTPASEVTTPPRTPETTSASSTSTTLGASDSGVGAAAAASGELTSVTKHVDGDTLWVGGGEKVRFIGMDTPETHGRTDCYGPEASARTAELLPLGTEVRLVYDAGRHDRYGRTLAYVYRASDGLFVNASLVRDGYARVMTVPPNVAHADEFLAVQREAREAARGFWGACGSSAATASMATTTVVATATTLAVRSPAGGDCHQSYTGTCIPPEVSDADCAGGGGDGPHHVQEKDIQVVGPDSFRLDADGNGVGCES